MEEFSQNVANWILNLINGVYASTYVTIGGLQYSLLSFLTAGIVLSGIGVAIGLIVNKT